MLKHMAGRPALSIGAHGKITRTEIGPGVWIARTHHRDPDGVTRRVHRRSPDDGIADRHGKRAEDALLAALADRAAPGSAVIGAHTLIGELIDAHIDRLEADDRAPGTIATYRLTAVMLAKQTAGLRVADATPPRIDFALRQMRKAHGPGEAKRAKTLIRGGLQLAVMAGVLTVNPSRDVSALSSPAPKGAQPLTAEQFAGLLAALRTSQRCAEADLADPIVLLMATGLRRSELLGLRWADYTPATAELRVTGNLVRVTGKGLIRQDRAKTEGSIRTVALPRFAVDMLAERKNKPYWGEQPMIFPSTAGTWRDPNNFGKQLRSVRDDLGLPDVTTHSFRKSVATLIDDAGLSARIGADQLGHAKVSMTQDKYWARGRVHPEVAELLDGAAKKA